MLESSAASRRLDRSAKVSSRSIPGAPRVVRVIGTTRGASFFLPAQAPDSAKRWEGDGSSMFHMRCIPSVQENKAQVGFKPDGLNNITLPLC